MTNLPSFKRLPSFVHSNVFRHSRNVEDNTSYDANGNIVKDYTQQTTLEDANLVTSQRDTPSGDGKVDYHHIVLDIDCPAALIESTTPGHHHLYIECGIPWKRYAFILWALRRAGVIQEGYYKRSMERGYTAVRPPWIEKPSKRNPIKPPRRPPVE